MKRALSIALFSLALALFAAGPIEAAPTCIAVASNAPTVVLSWTPPTTDINGAALPAGTVLTYNIYQGTTSGGETKVASGISGSGTTIATGLTSPGTFYFEATAVDPAGEGPKTNEVCVTFSGAPPGTFTITITAH